LLLLTLSELEINKIEGHIPLNLQSCLGAGAANAKYRG